METLNPCHWSVEKRFTVEDRLHKSRIRRSPVRQPSHSVDRPECSDSSMVELSAVNRVVQGSNPCQSANSRHTQQYYKLILTNSFYVEDLLTSSYHLLFVQPLFCFTTFFLYNPSFINVSGFIEACWHSSIGRAADL